MRIRIRPNTNCYAVAVSQDFFWHFFYMKLTWALDKQAKIVLLKDSFSRRYSNFLTSWQKILDYVEIVNIHLKNIFTIKARRGLQRQNWSRQNSAQCDTARSIRHLWIRGKLLTVDSAQCYTAQS